MRPIDILGAALRWTLPSGLVLGAGPALAQTGGPVGCTPAGPGPIDVTSDGYCADPGEGTPGDQDGVAIRLAIQDAATGLGGGVVYFPPGIYEVEVDPAAGTYSRSGLFLSQIANVTLQGATVGGKAEIRFRDRNARGFHLDRCSGLEVHDLTLRYEGVTHMEGRITGFTVAATHPVTGASVPMYTVELAPFFQALTGDPFLFPTTGATWVLVAHDPVTRRLKSKSSMMDADHARVAADGISVELFMTSTDVHPDDMNIAVPTDLGVVTVERDWKPQAGVLPGNIVYSRFSDSLLFEDVTILNSPFFAAQHDFDGGVVYRRCAIVPDPDLAADPALGPLGALVSTNRDGLRFVATRVGPQVIDCTFERCGDDPLNIHSNWHEVADTQLFGSTLYVHLRNLADPVYSIDVRNGDTLEALEPADLTTKAVTTVPLGPPILSAGGGGLWVPVNPTSPPLAVNDLVLVAEAQSNGFVVSGNTIRESRARGIYARGAQGTIADNVVAGTTLNGIVASPDLGPFFKEAGFNVELVVEGNTIHDVGTKRWLAHPMSTDLGALTIGLRHSQTLWPIGTGNQSIEVRDNWISTSRFAALFLGSVESAAVEDNHLLSAQLDPDAQAGSAAGVLPLGSEMGVFHLQNGLGVTHRGNVIDTEPFAGNVPHHTVSAATATDGGPVHQDCTEVGSGDAEQVFATSFELEEAWAPPLPVFGSGDPAIGSLHADTGVWSATIDGLPFTFSDWGLFGNHHALHHYRGYVATRCQKAGGSIVIDPPSQAEPTLLELWAAAGVPPGGTADYTFEVQVELATSGGWRVLDSVDPVTLPDPPDFELRSYALPPNVDRIRLLRKGGTDGSPPHLYVDDVVIRFLEPTGGLAHP